MSLYLCWQGELTPREQELCKRGSMDLLRHAIESAQADGRVALVLIGSDRRYTQRANEAITAQLIADGLLSQE